MNEIEQELGRKIPGALKKLSGNKWEWKPEIGELFIYKPHNRVYSVGYLGTKELYFLYCITHIDWGSALKTEVIPLLHWEKLERILEGMRYRLQQEDYGYNPKMSEYSYRARILYKAELPYKTAWLCAKTRQEAVCRAVLELAKRVK